jgi:hypothetical protein
MMAEEDVIKKSVIESFKSYSKSIGNVSFILN